MKLSLRLFPLMLLAILALGLVIPAAAQDNMMSLTAPDCSYGGEIKAIEAVDAMTVKFTLCAPDPAFLAKIAFSAMAIHSADQLQATGGGGDELLSNPIGTGRYKLAKWDHGNEMDFVRNDDYWGEKAIEPNFILRWNSEASARLVELQSGNADGIANLAPSDFAAVQSNPDLAVLPIPSTNILYLGINNTMAPFDNIKVRQAMSYAIDKKRIVDNFYPPGSTVATQFMPSSIFGYTKDSKVIPYDVKMANQLLDDAGFPKDANGIRFKTTLSYRDVVRGYLPQPGVIATDVQSQLKEIGIQADINVMESGAFLDAAQKGQLPLVLLGWGADYPDATNFLDYHFNNPNNKTFGNRDQKLDDMLTKAAQLSDANQRLAIYKDANDEIADFVPMVPIANGGSADAFAARIKGAYVPGFGATQYGLLEDPNDDNIVYIANSEPISLYCNDESDGETLRACEQVNESLLAYEPVGGAVKAALATKWESNADLTEWTFHLRDGVKFTDGSTFDANDVTTTMIAMWDASNPLHKGRTGDFTYWTGYFGNFLNAPKS